MALKGWVFTSLPAANSPVLRLNAICPYYMMFPLDFPFSGLGRARPGDLVLDPFSGRSTTSFAAWLRGFPSASIDSNPVAAAIAVAKLVCVDYSETTVLCHEILSDSKEPRQCLVGRSGDSATMTLRSEIFARSGKLRTRLRGGVK